MIYDVLHFNIFMILEDEAEAEDKWRVGRRALSGAGLGVPGPVAGMRSRDLLFLSRSLSKYQSGANMMQKILKIENRWCKYGAKYFKFEIF